MTSVAYTNETELSRDWSEPSRCEKRRSTGLVRLAVLGSELSDACERRGDVIGRPGADDTLGGGS